MNKSVRVIGWFLDITGVVWFLQGINLLPGSFMTGQPEWAVAGVAAVSIGLVIELGWRSNNP